MNRWNRVLWFAKTHGGLGRLKSQADHRLDRPAELVSLLFDFNQSALKPMQIDQELIQLVEEVRRLGPQAVLEIGTARGGTLFLWTRLAQKNALIVSIDLPGGKFGGGYSARRSTLYRRFAGKGQKLHLLRGDSHEQSMLVHTKKLLKGTPIDLLFIDGDHTYEGVKKDWEQYSPLVRSGGLVVFHDIAGNYDDTQVRRLWDSLKPSYRHREYIADPGGQYGIGILVK